MYIGIVIAQTTLANMDYHIQLESLLSCLQGGAYRTHHSSYDIVQRQSSSDIYTHSILLNISSVFNNSYKVDLAYYD